MTTSKAGAAEPTNSVALSGADRSRVAYVGWDPYEVWRTRVLLPRLAAQAAGNDAPVKTAASAAFLFFERRGSESNEAPGPAAVNS